MLQRPLSSASSPPTAGRTTLTLFLAGWVLMAAAEVLGIRGAPNVPFCLAVAAGILHGSEAGFWSGAAVGLAADLLSGLPLGTQALAGGLIGLAVGQASLALRPDAWGAPVLVLLGGSLPFRFMVQTLARLGGFPMELPASMGEAARIAGLDLALGFAAYLALSQMFAHRKV